ncbi:uncharacterized protein A4U43_C10F8870 [Asparagus officinalis]|uniref:Endonuclease/exonuclease/phosphatase domain-containing protein n=1 Tax=Asparagus officinalis TaxID=4686 RepID=A0A5P1E3B3_ASPOF|nr:uncharacterized protein A4U43_C10F8870 [Asparagus officinalis]
MCDVDDQNIDAGTHHSEEAKLVQQANILKHSGGLVVFSNLRTASVQVIHTNSQTIHLQVTEDTISYFLSCVYVRPHVVMKDAFQEDLQNFATSVNIPWVVIGDFNDLAFSHEKSGGAAFAVNRARKFIDRWDLCNLSDLGAFGSKFTWVRKINGRVVVRERLDRVLVNDLAREEFVEAKVLNLPRLHSDHHPILFNSTMMAPPPKENRPYRFQAA